MCPAFQLLDPVTVPTVYRLRDSDPVTLDPVSVLEVSLSVLSADCLAYQGLRDDGHSLPSPSSSVRFIGLSKTVGLSGCSRPCTGLRLTAARR